MELGGKSDKSSLLSGQICEGEICYGAQSKGYSFGQKVIS